MDEPQRYVLGVAYQAGRDPRIKKGADGARDFFTPEELELAAWYFAKSEQEVGIQHIDGTVGAATIVESYIWRGPDWVQADGTIVKAGDWLLGAVLDPWSWEMVQKGQLTGWSPQGAGRRREPLAKSEDVTPEPAGPGVSHSRDIHVHIHTEGGAS